MVFINKAANLISGLSDKQYKKFWKQAKKLTR